MARAHTELSASERAEAEQQPWERDPAIYERPPQHVVDYLDGQSQASPQPHPMAARRLQNFEVAWTDEARRLRNEGMSERAIEEERSKFKYRTLIEEVQ
jgi:hypothetical protein